MANRAVLNNPFQQHDNVCLLTSYGYAIHYYCSISNRTLSSSFFRDLFTMYLKALANGDFKPAVQTTNHQDDEMGQFLYHAVLDTSINIDKLGERDIQYLTFKALHFYCISIRNGLKGYAHIKEINDIITNSQQSLLCKIVPPVVKIENLIIETKGIKKDIILKHLDSGEHNLSLVLYQTSLGYHSVCVGKDHQGLFKRDPNYTSVLDFTDFSNPNLLIKEALLLSAK